MQYKVHGYVRLKAETESRALFESPYPRPLPIPRTLSALNTTRFEIKFFERLPHGYARRSKEAIPKRLYLDSISIDSG